MSLFGALAMWLRPSITLQRNMECGPGVLASMVSESRIHKIIYTKSFITKTCHSTGIYTINQGWNGILLCNKIHIPIQLSRYGTHILTTRHVCVNKDKATTLQTSRPLITPRIGLTVTNTCIYLAVGNDWYLLPAY